MIVSQTSHLHAAARTHPGMRGKNNEDRCAIATYTLSENDKTPSLLAIVADGIGGHRAGEVAAEIAISEISRVIGSSQVEVNEDTRQPARLLSEAFIQASRAIREQGKRVEGQSGMGATCVAAWIIGDRLYTASAGDSRLYWIREGQIYQLTIDHTWIQEAIDQGVLTREQATNHPNVHVVRRYLGSQNTVTPDLRIRNFTGEDGDVSESFQGMHLQPGDQLLLCSDGLSDLVKPEEILAALQNRQLDPALDSLVALANSRGGHDNITIIALQVPQSPQTLEPTVRIPARPVARALPAQKRQGVSPWVWIAGAFGVVGLCAFIVAVAIYFDVLVRDILGLLP